MQMGSGRDVKGSQREPFKGPWKAREGAVEGVRRCCERGCGKAVSAERLFLRSVVHVTNPRFPRADLPGSQQAQSRGGGYNELRCAPISEPGCPAVGYLNYLGSAGCPFLHAAVTTVSHRTDTVECIEGRRLPVRSLRLTITRFRSFVPAPSRPRVASIICITFALHSARRAFVYRTAYITSCCAEGWRFDVEGIFAFVGGGERTRTPPTVYGVNAVPHARACARARTRLPRGRTCLRHRPSHFPPPHHCGCPLAATVAAQKGRGLSGARGARRGIAAEGGVGNIAMTARATSPGAGCARRGKAGCDADRQCVDAPSLSSLGAGHLPQ
eukprot:gene17427-biopygen1710